MKYSERPKVCDHCGKDLSSIPPERQLQPKAVGLLALALVVSFPWAVIVYLLLGLAASMLPQFRIIIPIYIVYLLWLPVLAAIVAPGYLIGTYAYSLPKVIRQQCYYCKTKRVYLIDQHG